MYWILWLFVAGAFGQQYADAQGQRVAPGVPPQQYQQHQQMHQQVPQQQMHQQHHQQPPHQQQQQQQQQQQFQHQQQQQFQQQIPVQQQQQVPVQQQPPIQQQQHQQIPVQHVPVQNQGHNHDHAHNPQQLLNTANIAHEKAHIAEHLDVPMDTSKMTDQELQFHYFKMHDADNNNKLDGCELIKSLIHWHEQGNKEPGAPNAGDKLFKDEELVALIDPILGMDDVNKDGFIDYPEFIQAQQKAAASGTQ